MEMADKALIPIVKAICHPNVRMPLNDAKIRIKNPSATVNAL